MQLSILYFVKWFRNLNRAQDHCIRIRQLLKIMVIVSMYHPQNNLKWSNINDLKQMLALSCNLYISVLKCFKQQKLKKLKLLTLADLRPAQSRSPKASVERHWRSGAPRRYMDCGWEKGWMYDLSYIIKLYHVIVTIIYYILDCWWPSNPAPPHIETWHGFNQSVKRYRCIFLYRFWNPLHYLDGPFHKILMEWIWTFQYWIIHCWGQWFSAMPCAGGGWWWVVGVLSLLAGSASSTGAPVLVLANRATSKAIKNNGGRGKDGEEGQSEKPTCSKIEQRTVHTEWTPTIPLLSSPTFCICLGGGTSIAGPTMSRSAVGQQIARSYPCWSEIWNIKRLALQESDISKQQGQENS